MAGEGPPAGAYGMNYTLHSGFTYPLAYIAKALGFVFHLSSVDSLELASKFLPPAVALVSMVVLYFAVAKIINRRVAVFSVLTWALFGETVFVGVAGFLDRDALTALLLMIGGMLFYFSRRWRLSVGNIDVGWVVSGLSVLLVEVLLYLEWSLVGAVALLAIIFVYSVLKLLLEYSSLLEKEPNVMQRIAVALRRSDLRAFVLVAAINLVAVGLYSHQTANVYDTIMGIVRSRFSAGTAALAAYTAAEQRGLSLQDLIGFQFFLIPMGLGTYLAWKQRNDAIVFFASWFVSFFILSFLVYRMILLALPAVCVISGVGLASLWGIMSRRDRKALWPQLGVAALLVLLLIVATVQATSLNRNYIMAADNDWQQALTYLRENTPQDAVIISQWSYGYWFLDVAQREPFVDNGYYGYTIDELRDVGLAYSTPDPSEASAIMEKRGTDYLVFGKQDLDLATPILTWAGVNGNKDSFPDDSLVVRSLKGDFLSGDGLEVVFRNNEVVVLALIR
jgi:asparagine N-glycosylation enzyme membrane subunit Stt3